MMGLRADMTPQVARIATTRLGQKPRPRDPPRRANACACTPASSPPTASRPGRHRADRPRQPRCRRRDRTVGAEALAAVGLTRLSFDLTMPPLVPTLLDETGFTADARARLGRALDRKDAAAVRDRGGPLAATLTDLLLAAGAAERALGALAQATLTPGARAHADRLAATVAAIHARAPALKLTVDPVEFRGLRYHTGVCLTIYAPGRHEELGRGGRYICGEAEAATGLTLYPDAVLRAAPPRPPHPRLYLPYGTDAARAAAARATALPPSPRWKPCRTPQPKQDASAAPTSLPTAPPSPWRSDAMANVAVIGAQWGDEGKGKVVDWLASRADVVVRFQGGHNAGHTLVVGNETYKLSLLPSGLVRGKLGIIGNGVVVDPEALLAEIEKVRTQGLTVTPETLLAWPTTRTLILPLHPALDRAREAARGERRIGTTGRGIGPAYEDKVARRAIRVCRSRTADARRKLDELLLHHNALLAGRRRDLRKQVLLDRCWRCAAHLPYAAGLGAARRVAPSRQTHPVRGRAGGDAGRRSRHLSVRHLIQHRRRPPPPPAPASARRNRLVLGIAKAYATRVGSVRSRPS